MSKRLSGLVPGRRRNDSSADQQAEEDVDWSLPIGASAAPAIAPAAAPTAELVDRTATVAEGLRILKAGAVVTKYGRGGQPHSAKLTLSGDERMLGWVSQGVSSKLKKASGSRTVLLDDILDLRVGHETNVFKRHVREAMASGKVVAAGPHRGCTSQTLKHHLRHEKYHLIKQV